MRVGRRSTEGIGFAHLRVALDVLRRVLDQRRALSENGNPLGQVKTRHACRVR